MIEKRSENPTNQINPTPMVTVEKKVKPLTIIIIVMAVLLIGTGGFFLSKFFHQPKACTTEAKICPDGSVVGRTGPNCEVAPCPTQVPSATSTPDETANWKTYTSVKNKYSFLYPEEWFITNKPLHMGGDNLDIAIESSQKDEFVILAQPEGFGMAPGEGTLVSERVIKIDGIDGTENISEDLITVRVKKGNIWFLISYQFDISKKDKNMATFDQILSTFKFLD